MVDTIFFCMFKNAWSYSKLRVAGILGPPSVNLTSALSPKFSSIFFKFSVLTSILQQHSSNFIIYPLISESEITRGRAFIPVPIGEHSFKNYENQIFSCGNLVLLFNTKCYLNPERSYFLTNHDNFFLHVSFAKIIAFN